MLIFYSESRGRPKYRGESPVRESLASTLDIICGLDSHPGFLGIPLSEHFALQLPPKKIGVRIELLNSSLPAADSCVAVNG